MKLKTKVSGQDKEVEVSRQGTALTAAVNGRAYDLTLQRMAAGEYLMQVGFEIFRCRVETTAGRSNTFVVSIRGRNYEVGITDPKRLRASQNSGTHHGGTAEVVSPMPGKIVRVLVEQGTTVEANAGIVIVEAMKMQNEMKAPKAGVVVTINAKEGETVNAGDVLAVIE